MGVRINFVIFRYRVREFFKLNVEFYNEIVLFVKKNQRFDVLNM